MERSEVTKLVWLATAYAAGQCTRQLTMADLALLGVGPDEIGALKEELHRRDWLAGPTPEAYIEFAVEPRLIKVVETVEFGCVFEHDGSLMYIPHDAPLEEERDDPKSGLVQPEAKHIVLAKRVKDEGETNPTGRWHRISWGTLVLTKPETRLVRKPTR
jgi:hypothetical protein